MHQSCWEEMVFPEGHPPWGNLGFEIVLSFQSTELLASWYAGFDSHNLWSEPSGMVLHMLHVEAESICALTTFVFPLWTRWRCAKNFVGNFLPVDDAGIVSLAKASSSCSVSTRLAYRHWLCWLPLLLQARSEKSAQWFCNYCIFSC